MLLSESVRLNHTKGLGWFVSHPRAHLAFWRRALSERGIMWLEGQGPALSTPCTTSSPCCRRLLLGGRSPMGTGWDSVFSEWSTWHLGNHGYKGTFRSWSNCPHHHHRYCHSCWCYTGRAGCWHFTHPHNSLILQIMEPGLRKMGRWVRSCVPGHGAGKWHSWDLKFGWLLGSADTIRNKQDTELGFAPWSPQIPGLLSFPAASTSCHQPCLALTHCLPCSQESTSESARLQGNTFLRDSALLGIQWGMWLGRPFTIHDLAPLAPSWDRPIPSQPSLSGPLLNCLELSTWSRSSPPLASFSLALPTLHQANSSLTFRPRLTHHLLQAAFPDRPNWARCLSSCFLCRGVASYTGHCDFLHLPPHSRRWGPWRQWLVLFSIKFPLNPHLLAPSGTERCAGDICCILT